MPFAIVGSEDVLEVNGRRVRARQYPWGLVEVENPRHSDFLAIRSALLHSHLADLKEITHDFLYENYRTEKLSKSVDGGVAKYETPATLETIANRFTVHKTRLSTLKIWPTSQCGLRRSNCAARRRSYARSKSKCSERSTRSDKNCWPVRASYAKLKHGCRESRATVTISMVRSRHKQWRVQAQCTDKSRQRCVDSLASELSSVGELQRDHVSVALKVLTDHRMVEIPMSIASFNYFLRAENSSADENKVSHNVDSLEQAWKSRNGQHHTAMVFLWLYLRLVPYYTHAEYLMSTADCPTYLYSGQRWPMGSLRSRPCMADIGLAISTRYFHVLAEKSAINHEYSPRHVSALLFEIYRVILEAIRHGFLKTSASILYRHQTDVQHQRRSQIYRHSRVEVASVTGQPHKPKLAAHTNTW